MSLTKTRTPEVEKRGPIVPEVSSVETTAVANTKMVKKDPSDVEEVEEAVVASTRMVKIKMASMSTTLNLSTKIAQDTKTRTELSVVVVAEVAAVEASTIGRTLAQPETMTFLPLMRRSLSALRSK